MRYTWAVGWFCLVCCSYSSMEGGLELSAKAATAAVVKVSVGAATFVYWGCWVVLFGVHQLQLYGSKCTGGLLLLLAIISNANCNSGMAVGIVWGWARISNGFDQRRSVGLRWQLGNAAGLSQCMNAVCLCLDPCAARGSSTSKYMAAAACSFCWPLRT
jgi:hypothetical protein